MTKAEASAENKLQASSTLARRGQDSEGKLFVFRIRAQSAVVRPCFMGAGGNCRHPATRSRSAFEPAQGFALKKLRIEDAKGGPQC